MIISVLFYIIISTVIATEPRIGNDWEDVPGKLKVISSGSSGVWGVDEHNDVYVRVGTYNYGTISENPSPGTIWKKIDGKLFDISSGYNIVWGTMPKTMSVLLRRGINSTNPYGTHWERLGGLLKRVSVNSRTNEVWGLYSNGFVFKREGIPELELESDFAGKRWRYVPGRLRFISVSDSGVWGLSFTGDVLYHNGTRKNPSSEGEDEWINVGGIQMKQIQGGYDIVWAIDKQNNVFFRQGISDAKPTGTQWLPVAGKFSYLATNTVDGSVWGIDSANNIFYRKNARLVNIGYSPWTHFGECHTKYGYRFRLRYCIDNEVGKQTEICSDNLRDFTSCSMDGCTNSTLEEL